MHSLERKLECQRALCGRLGLPHDLGVPLFGIIGRLVIQKGIDLLLDALPQLLPSGLQLVVLGSGQREYEEALVGLARRWPRQLAVTLEFDDPLRTAIEAGCDFFLMPSRYEPCGLNQMYSLRYGTVPIVRRTGGLADTVIDATPQALADGSANGFVFDEASAVVLQATLRRAMVSFEDRAAWRDLQRAGMRADFSWSGAARRYLDVYTRAVGLHDA